MIDSLRDASWWPCVRRRKRFSVQIFSRVGERSCGKGERAYGKPGYTLETTTLG